jgi:hypothetical protein
MSWRRITLNDEAFRWTVSATARGDLDADLELVVVVRPVGRGSPALRAHLLGWVARTWAYRAQSLAVTPGVVRRLVEEGRRQGWPTRGPLDLGPEEVAGCTVDAHLPLDRADQVLAAAAAEWFRPYPGRAVLEELVARHGPDSGTIAAALGEAPDAIRAWLKRLGLASGDRHAEGPAIDRDFPASERCRTERTS